MPGAVPGTMAPHDSPAPPPGPPFRKGLQIDQHGSCTRLITPAGLSRGRPLTKPCTPRAGDRDPPAEQQGPHSPRPGTYTRGSHSPRPGTYTRTPACAPWAPALESPVCLSSHSTHHTQAWTHRRKYRHDTRSHRHRHKVRTHTQIHTQIQVYTQTHTCNLQDSYKRNGRQSSMRRRNSR